MLKYMKGKSGTIDFGWESGTLNLDTDGGEAVNNNFIRSSFISTKGLSKWKLVIDGTLATENRINTVWYAADKTYYGRGLSFTETTDGITAPYDAKFIRFVIKKEFVDLVKLVPNTEERLESAEERLNKLETIDFGWESGTLNLNGDGSEAENNNYVRSSYIPTKELSKWKLVINGTLTERINTALYREDKTYYRRGDHYLETTDDITVSNDAKFIRFVVRTIDVNLVKLDPKTEERLEGVEERLEGAEERVDGVESVISDVRQGVEDVERDIDAICDGYKNLDFGWEYGTVDANGDEAPATSLKRSAFLPADLLRGVTLNIESEEPLSSGDRVNDWFYKENKSFIGRGSSYTATAKISIPPEAVYVRFVAAAATPDKVSAVVLARQYDVVLNNAIDDVRQGVEDAERDIDAICNGYKNLDFGWEFGTVDANGDEAPATGRKRSAFLPADLLRGVTLNIDSDEPLSSTDRVACWTYAADKTAQGIYKRITASVTLNDIPADAVYLRFVAAAATPDKVSAVVLARQYDVELNNAIDDVRQGVEDVERELESVRSALPDHSVASLNRDKEHLLYDAWQARDQQLQGKSVDDPNGSALGFLHFSDIHGNLVSWKRLGAYLDHFGDMFSFAIHTGDYVPSSQSDYNSDSGNMYQRVTTVKPIFNCVGNHDVILGNNQNADLSSTRNILFSDISNWGVTCPSNDAMYYYRDFDDVRLIVLDQYYANVAESEYYANDAELTWLGGVLDDAKNNGKSVITASHTQTAPITHNISTFNNIDRPSSALPATNGFEDKIKAFKRAGGTHICHLGGHWHWDVVGTTDNGILNILVECATFYGGGYRNDIRRYGDKLKVNSRAYDCFNAIFVDTQTKTLRIIRIGSNSDNYLHPKNTLCIDYAAGTLIANG